MRLHVLALSLGLTLASSPVLVEGGGSHSSNSPTLMHVGELATGLMAPTMVLARSDCSLREHCFRVPAGVLGTASKRAPTRRPGTVAATGSSGFSEVAAMDASG
jgi:hypothetical protein